MSDDYDEEQEYFMMAEAFYNGEGYNQRDELIEQVNDAIDNLKDAEYKLGKAYLALGTFEERVGNMAAAAKHYGRAASHYRKSDAPDETIEVVVDAYMRCWHA